MEIPINMKLNLTINEASQYSGLGISKIRELLRRKDCDFMLKNGSKYLIKRKKFESYLEALHYI